MSDMLLFVVLCTAVWSLDVAFIQQPYLTTQSKQLLISRV